ncbi:unnamed protein product, partial [Leptidea sinapis]
LFLQSPANPDLLYIIFFCHTQLTVTLLLCFIFGSKIHDDLIILRDRCLPAHQTMRKINAMVEAAAAYDRKAVDSGPLKLNTVFSAVADRLMCTVTPAEESSSSGRDITFDPPPTYKHKQFISKSVETSIAEQSQTDVTTDSPKRRTDLNEETTEVKNGVFKISGEANCGDIRPPEVNSNCYKCDKSEKSDKNEIKTSPNSDVRSVRSGHARTHAIVINLDDKSRFTEEVTV